MKTKAVGMISHVVLLACWRIGTVCSFDSYGADLLPRGHLAAGRGVSRLRRVAAHKEGERARRFEAMLSSATFADSTIVRVGDARIATILRGIRAVREDEAARLAFEILYCDFAPVRLAGDLVFRQIEKLVSDKIKKSEATQAFTMLASQFDADDVLVARDLFQAIDLDGSGTLDHDEVLRSGFLRSLGECSNCTCREVDTCASVDRFVRQVDADADGHITFVDFMQHATNALYKQQSWDDMLRVLRPTTDNSDKFDRMCDEFRSWNTRRRAFYEQNPSQQVSPSRVDLILDGCFAGLENKKLLPALRIVYEDYGTLRVCAGLIFRLTRSAAQRAPWYNYKSETASQRRDSSHLALNIASDCHF